MKKILLATGQDLINKAVSKFEGFEIIGTIALKSEIEKTCISLKPDIVLIAETLEGSELLIEIIIRAKNSNPNTRFIYLAGDVNIKDSDKVNRLATLVMAGIYDIHHERKINVALLKNMLENPRAKEHVDYLLRYIKKEQSLKDNLVEIEGIDEEKIDIDEQGYSNVIVISSIKPGTGKSFISTNVATAIAKFGKKKDGKPPKVAIIEGDLQNLSVGTLLQIEDNEHNLKTVMVEISKIMTKEGDIHPNITPEKMAEVDKYIKSCFKPYYHVKNLEALVGSQLTIDEVDNISPYYYMYILDVITKEYDVVIIDSNSSLGHITTFPLLRSASKAYYIINLDFNNVRNNSRYRSTLESIGLKDKVHYILNEDIEAKEDEEALIFTAEHLNESGFKIEAKIPEIPKTIFLNRLYEGTPIVLDNTNYTIKARLELSKVANQIWEVDNLKDLENAYEKMIIVQNQGKKKGLFNRHKSR